jgi:hypothetical protein
VRRQRYSRVTKLSCGPHTLGQLGAMDRTIDHSPWMNDGCGGRLRPCMQVPAKPQPRSRSLATKPERGA